MDMNVYLNSDGEKWWIGDNCGLEVIDLSVIGDEAFGPVVALLNEKKPNLRRCVDVPMPNEETISGFSTEALALIATNTILYETKKTDFTTRVINDVAKDYFNEGNEQLLSDSYRSHNEERSQDAFEEVLLSWRPRQIPERYRNSPEMLISKSHQIFLPWESKNFVELLDACPVTTINELMKTVIVMVSETGRAFYDDAFQEHFLASSICYMQDVKRGLIKDQFLFSPEDKELAWFLDGGGDVLELSPFIVRPLVRVMKKTHAMGAINDILVATLEDEEKGLLSFSEAREIAKPENKDVPFDWLLASVRG